MLTGDKVETACCVATVSGLKPKNADFFKIVGQTDPYEVDKKFSELEQMDGK